MPKVLLVEDNEMNRDMLSRRLQRQGYEIVMAVDGAQGVEMAKSEQPALILMDMSLPVMDGWEATKVIKANPETNQIPVIGLTADLRVRRLHLAGPPSARSARFRAVRVFRQQAPGGGVHDMKTAAGQADHALVRRRRAGIGWIPITVALHILPGRRTAK